MRWRRVRLSLFILAIVGAQALLALHWYEHPVLEPHPCHVKQLCRGVAHALAPTPTSVHLIAGFAFTEILLVVPAVVSLAAESSIRAPST